MRVAEIQAIARAAIEGRQERGGKIRAHCPFCEEKIGKRDNRFSLVYFVDTTRVACYRCRTWTYLSDERDEDGEIVRKKAAPKEVRPFEVPYGCYPAWSRSAAESIVAGPGVEYLLRERRVRPDVIRATKIHLGVCGTFAFSVVIPLLADDGFGWLGYVSRAWGAKTYRNATGMVRGRFFNHAAVRVATSIPLITVEGAFDALPSYPHASGFLGKPTDEHIETLVTCPRPVVLGLDADAREEGWRAALQVYCERQMRVARGELERFLPVACITFPPGLDPGNFSGAETMSAAKRAIELVGTGPPTIPEWTSRWGTFDCVLPAAV